MPARTSVITDAPAPQRKFTRDLFNKFYKHCGGCHVDGASGGFHVEGFTQFAPVLAAYNDKLHERITSDDPLRFMPPAVGGGKPWSERADDDPVRTLLSELDEWFAANQPPDFYEVAAPEDMMSRDESPYLLSDELAASLTNIGSCMPNKQIVGMDGDTMGSLDSMFEEATELPPRLDQTDLASFDSEKLARQGVLSFAPAYTLFSDGSRKMRHLRVPRGQSIAFDPDRQEFDIPANTRFYKTFLKRVIDAEGQERYRKIETRVIVARPDGPDASDGSHETTALFGTYAWNENETEALLVTDPLRNGKPFADRVITYVTDEGRAAEVLGTDPPPLLPLVALRSAGVVRTYAIPGSERCIQCHMGSSNKSFILGFTPIQVARRPLGEGGVFEAASDDELGQLERLIDYKVVTGIESATDVLPLEESQGDRKPRNDHELTAQGYMLGNCGFCHNPRGYPTVQNPQLRDVLRFFPDREGGIFQFPLELTSPRIKRGVRQDVEVPYITPSLFDREEPGQDELKHHRHSFVSQKKEAHHQAAPWRSLIYRNVDSPFTYAEDYALFPHMPMNVAGFDCRAPRIMGDWMVSIPARKVDSKLNERFDMDYEDASGNAVSHVQPYVEVKPDELGYDDAVADAERRLELYRRGGEDENVFNKGELKTEKTIQHDRYESYCPDTSDIIDPNIGIGSELASAQLTPQDVVRLPSLYSDPTTAPTPDLSDETMQSDYILATQVPDGVPDRPHWVETDVSDPPGEWTPRRSDWSDILVKGQVADLDPRQKTVIELLQTLHADDAFRAFSVEPKPFGLWVDKPECKLGSVPKVADFVGTERPQWMSLNADATADRPVYMQSAGAMVFNEICVNCHGPRFDSRGRQADTLMLMTGGASRVANLREGLIGPSEDPGANRMRVFGAYADANTTAQDWAARYVPWMGLGGTRRAIPESILSLVGTTQVLGERREGFLPVTDANMLATAQTLCAHTIGWKKDVSYLVRFDPMSGAINHAHPSDGTSLVSKNGDAETWQRLCSFRNPPPVRIVTPVSSAQYLITGDFNNEIRWYRNEFYPKGAPIGNQHGEVENGLTPDNLGPWCVHVDESIRAQVDLYVQNERAGKPLPICPEWWREDAARTYALSEKEVETWTLRGAINAGVAVFFHLDQALRDEQAGKPAFPAFDHCEDLK